MSAKTIDILTNIVNLLDVPFLGKHHYPAGWAGTNDLGCVHLKLSLETPSQWRHGIIQNSPFCQMSLRPTEDGRICIEQYARGGGMPKMRKTTVHIEKVMTKLQTFIDDAKNAIPA